MIYQNNDNPEGKKNLLKIEDLKPLETSVCEDLTSTKQSNIHGGGISGTGSPYDSYRPTSYPNPYFYYRW